MIRIGAHPKALPEWVPFGTDLEKRKWTPGIYDDVSVIACNNPYIETLQIAPDINTSRIKVQTKVINYMEAGSFSMNCRVKEWKGGSDPSEDHNYINYSDRDGGKISPSLYPDAY